MQKFNEIVALIAIAIVFVCAVSSDFNWDGTFVWFLLTLFLLWHAWKFMVWIAIDKPEGDTAVRYAMKRLGQWLIKSR